jgi:N-acetylglucosaminyl-diphospho-decaprenol L-rhamnosyltransferase
VIDVSIIIVSFNTRTDLERCLGSLVNTPPEATHEIIVVDNASSDGSARAAETFRGVRVIRCEHNAGFAVANNIGIKASSGSHLLLLNSDTIVPAGSVDLLLERIRREPSVGVVGPRLVDRNGRPELSFGAMITPLNERRQQRIMRALAQRRRWAVELVESMTSQEQRPDWVSGACLLVRRADALAVGLLDERYFMYTEDVDFCASIRARGRAIVFTPDVEITHLRGRSAATAPAATRAAYERSQRAFYEKHHSWAAPLLRLFRALTRDR